MESIQYDEFIRRRITELRLNSNISEHRMSLDLDKSGSYVRAISSGMALPSLKELFNIIAYFNMTPAEFFAPMEDSDTPFHRLCAKLRKLDDEGLKKVDTFVDWIE